MSKDNYDDIDDDDVQLPAVAEMRCSAANSLGGEEEERRSLNCPHKKHGSVLFMIQSQQGTIERLGFLLIGLWWKL